MTDAPRSLAALKLHLLCLGARWTGPVGDGPGRPLLRTRAGLGSGLELRLGRATWVNVPVLEPFAAASPYEVVGAGDGRVEVRRDGRAVARGVLAPRPAWYGATTASGRPMTRVATMQGTVLAVYAGRVCDLWVPGPARAARESCRFCAVGLNVGADDDPRKSDDDVLEVVHAARRDPGLMYVDLNCGHADDGRHVERLLPLARRIRRETGLLVGLQTPPHPDPATWAAVRAAGVNRVSFCLELWDPTRFAEVCPGKHRHHGQAAYLAAIDACVALRRAGPRGAPWVVQGELVAGLEPPARTIEAIDALTRRGAVPTVCVFRPLRGTDLAGHPPPDPAAMAPVFAALYARCVAAGLPVGAARGVRPSLVLLPEEARTLVDDPAARRALQPAERRLRWRCAAARPALALRRLASAALRAPRAAARGGRADVRPAAARTPTAAAPGGGGAPARRAAPPS